MKKDKARGRRVARVVGEISVGPPLGVDPVGQIRLWIVMYDASVIWPYYIGPSYVTLYLIWI